jgi:hypothetical protein
MTAVVMPMYRIAAAPEGARIEIVQRAYVVLLVRERVYIHPYAIN